MFILNPKLHKAMKQIVVSQDTKIRLKDFYANPDKYEEVANYTREELHKLSEDILEHSRLRLEEAQEKLWACKKYGVLIVLQGMDTAGKDGTIKHVMSGVNPQGCRVASFKTPTTIEHAHDFLWRHYFELPSRGEIVIFNRSHYENVLVTKVHPEFMEDLPDDLKDPSDKEFWEHRYQDIRAFERHLARNGTLILKFFLHISKSEQKRRLLDRLSNEDKYWKLSPADIKERQYWDQYIDTYDEMLSRTSTEYAPWIIIPANNKKIARALVADTIATAIGNLKINYPEVTKAQINELKKTKIRLEKEQDK